jgi:hypothetical protein
MSEADRAYEVIHWARRLLEEEARRRHDSAPPAARAVRQVAEDLWLRRAEVVPCSYAGEWLLLRLRARTTMLGPYSAAEKGLLEPLLALLVEREGPEAEYHWTRTAPTSDAAPFVKPRERMVS